MTGVQVPGAVGSLHVWHIVGSQEELQQTPSMPQTPAAHSSVVPQGLPGTFFVWQFPLLSQ